MTVTRSRSLKVTILVPIKSPYATSYINHTNELRLYLALFPSYRGILASDKGASI